MYNSKLKITEEDFNNIKEIINWYFTNCGISKKEHIESYENGKFPLSDKVKDLNMRFRWDVFYQAITKSNSKLCLGYLNDNHLDSALKIIINVELKKRY